MSDEVIHLKKEDQICEKYSGDSLILGAAGYQVLLCDKHSSGSTLQYGYDLKRKRVY